MQHAYRFYLDGGRNVQRLKGLGPSSTTDSVYAMVYTPLKSIVACKILSRKVTTRDPIK